jgi:predicted metal-dependent hydrolase
MANSQIIQVDGIGAVTFTQSPRARRVVITIRPRRGVRVSIPRHNTIEDGMSFVRKKETWIKKHLAIIRDKQTQNSEANAAFLNIDKKAARKKITGRLRELAKANGFTFERVSLRNQRTRWGSCSGKGNLSFNLKLVILPQELMDYVIFHELVHTKIHNHSERFWQEVDKFVGNGKAKARTLKEWGLGIL